MPKWITGIFDQVLEWIAFLRYVVAIVLCGIVRALYRIYEIFAGIKPVYYQGKPTKLMNVFFHNQSVTNAYWGMALIGIAMAFGFAIIALIRKIFDLNDKNQMSIGGIIGNLLRSIFFMISLSFGMTVVLEFSDVLLNQIGVLFENASSLHLELDREYTDDELSAMARVLNTIGNYSFNPTYNSRYNLNACFNEIRPEMEWLQKQGVFDYPYPRKDKEGNQINNWQNALQRIANAKGLSEPARADVYYDEMSSALMEVMDIMHTDKNFFPLKHFSRTSAENFSSNSSIPLDRMCFLAGTMDAAENEDFNKNPSVTDALRGRFYLESEDSETDMSIYNYDDVKESFSVSKIDFVYIYLTAIFMAAELLAIVGNCIARIFNVIFLYLIAPPFFATWSLDNGAKAKQWLTAFIIQNFSVFATVLSVRVVQLFIPIITSGDLVLFDWTTLPGSWAAVNWAAPVNYLAKLLMIIVAFLTARKASGVVTGILADNAGMQAIGASDSVGSAMRGLVGAAAGGAINLATGGAAALAGKAFGDKKEGGDSSSSEGGEGGGEKEQLPQKSQLGSEGSADGGSGAGSSSDGADGGSGAGSGSGAGGKSGGEPKKSGGAGGKKDGELPKKSSAGEGDGGKGNQSSGGASDDKDKSIGEKIADKAVDFGQWAAGGMVGAAAGTDLEMDYDFGRDNEEDGDEDSEEDGALPENAGSDIAGEDGVDLPDAEDGGSGAGSKSSGGAGSKSSGGAGGKSSGGTGASEKEEKSVGGKIADKAVDFGQWAAGGLAGAAAGADLEMDYDFGRDSAKKNEAAEDEGLPENEGADDAADGGVDLPDADSGSHDGLGDSAEAPEKPQVQELNANAKAGDT
ncbi:MAG: hypothetical protein IJ711_08865, partial [Lachnospiraceae bacterium]|nr:hypothetical protein [Lachnospiraceae bacterium]